MLGATALDEWRPQLHKALLEEAAGIRLPQLNEPGWTGINGGMSADVLTGLNRQTVNDEVQRYYYTDPQARHMVQLQYGYVFGRGVTIRAKDNTVDDYLQRHFWKAVRNRHAISSAQAQRRLHRMMALNGEFTLLLFTSTLTGRVTVRLIDPRRVVQVVYAPTDSMPVGYKVQWDAETQVVVPDYRFAADQADAPGLSNTIVSAMHVVGNEFPQADGGVRGISPLSVSLPWIKAMKGFMEDRATLTMAQALFAWRLKVRGNRQAVERARDQFQAYNQERRYPTADGRERRQGGNVMVQNDAVEATPVRTDSMAYNAYQDMRMFRQMGAIGQGVFEHYMGDPSTGNLATATAMELPMLKLYEAEQQFYGESVFTELANYAVLQGIRHGTLRGGMARMDTSAGYWVWDVEPAGDTDLTVDVMFPPIVQKDLGMFTQAISAIKQAEAVSGKQILPPKETAEAVLGALGYSSVANHILNELEDKDFAMDTPTPPPTGPNDREPTPPEPETADVREADIGEPLPDKEATKVKRVKRSEIDKAFDDWAALPDLDEMARRLGFDSADDLDNA